MAGLLVAFGNPLREDDSVAWHVADRVRQRRPEHAVLTVHQLTPELALDVSAASHVVFVDAAAQGRPGEVRRGVVHPASSEVSDTHDLSPEALLALCRILTGAAPPAVLVTIAGASFGFSESLSEVVRQALESATETVEAALDKVAPARPPDQSSPSSAAA